MVSVRSRATDKTTTMTLDEFCEQLLEEIRTRA